MPLITLLITPPSWTKQTSYNVKLCRGLWRTFCVLCMFLCNTMNRQKSLSRCRFPPVCVSVLCFLSCPLSFPQSCPMPYFLSCPLPYPMSCPPFVCYMFVRMVGEKPDRRPGEVCRINSTIPYGTNVEVKGKQTRLQYGK